MTKPEEVLLSRDQHRVALCINSFSTPPGGVVAPIVDVGQGPARPTTTAGTSAARSCSATRVPGGSGRWPSCSGARSASCQRRSSPTSGPDRRDRPKTRNRETSGTSSNGGVCRTTTRGARSASRPLRGRPRASGRALRPARRASEWRSSPAFHRGPSARSSPRSRARRSLASACVLVAHVQEPGANDNATGCATLVELARAMLQGIRDRKHRARRAGRSRSSGATRSARSRQWIADHPAEAKKVRYMFSLDMTGENTTLTGGTFLIEKAPTRRRSGTGPRTRTPNGAAAQ